MLEVFVKGFFLEVFCWNFVLVGSFVVWLVGVVVFVKGFFGVCVVFVLLFVLKGEFCLGWLLKELMVLLLVVKGFVLVGVELVVKGLNGDGCCVVWLEVENIWIDDVIGVVIIYLIRGV